MTHTRDAYFWAVHSAAEIDLFCIKNERRYGFEFKCADAPEMTRSMATAIADLKLDKLFVVYPGDKSYALDACTTVVSAKELESIW
jgi:hypothetical protein